MNKKWVYLFKEGNASQKSLLGGKGSNLAEMTNIGLPVPQGFIVTTEACTEFYNQGEKLTDEIISQIRTNLSMLEKQTEKVLAMPLILFWCLSGQGRSFQCRE